MAMQRLSGRRRLVPPPPRTDEERALLSTALVEGDDSDAAGPSTGDGGVIEIQQLLQSLEAHQSIPYDQLQRRAAARLFALSSERVTALRNPFLVASLLRTLVPSLSLLSPLSQSNPEAYQSLVGLLVNLFLHGSDKSKNDLKQSSSCGAAAAAALPSSTPFRCDDDALCSVLSFLPASDWFVAIRCSRQLYALRSRASAWPARPLVPLSVVGRTLSDLLFTCSASLQLRLVSLFVKATAIVAGTDSEPQPRSSMLHAVHRLLELPDVPQFPIMLLMQPDQPVSTLALRFLNQAVAVSDEMAERIYVSSLIVQREPLATTGVVGTVSQTARPSFSFVPVLLVLLLLLQSGPQHLMHFLQVLSCPIPLLQRHSCFLLANLATSSVSCARDAAEAQADGQVQIGDGTDTVCTRVADVADDDRHATVSVQQLHRRIQLLLDYGSVRILSALLLGASSDESVRREAAFALANIVANAHDRDVERIVCDEHIVGVLACFLVSSSSSPSADRVGEEEADPPLMRILLESLDRLLGWAASYVQPDSSERCALPPRRQIASVKVAQEMHCQGVEATLQKLASPVTDSSSSAATAAATEADESHRQFVRAMASDMLCTYFSSCNPTDAVGPAQLASRP
jgi:hypothetical protein